MATLLWERDIDKTVNWAGDESTQGRPVSGEYVQKFIKETLNKKFGYLYYDRANSKYWVFADESDYNKYASDTTGVYADLRLAIFDAPAPATFDILAQSEGEVISLLGATGNEISLRYFIKDSSNRAVTEAVSVRVNFNRGGEVKSFTRTVQPGPGAKDEEVGTEFTFNIDEYLRDEGQYTVTVTLTGLTTQAVTSVTFFYSIVNLSLNVTLENSSAFSTASSTIPVSYSVHGAAGTQKTLEMYVDGIEYKQNVPGINKNLTLSSGDNLGSQVDITGFINLYINDNYGNPVVWGTEAPTSLVGTPVFTPGKHTLQIRVFIPNGPTDKIYSVTKYFEFVVSDASSIESYTYLIYTAEAKPGELFDASEGINFSTSQYEVYSFNIMGINTLGNPITVEYLVESVTRDSDGNITSTESLYETNPIHAIASGGTDTFNYSFATPGEVRFSIFGYERGSILKGDPQLILIFNVDKFDTGNEVIEESDPYNLLVKYTATNRSNSEAEKDKWVNSSPYYKDQIGMDFPAIFSNKILWNNQDGWDGEALVLRNGATVELPIDLFGRGDSSSSLYGTYFSQLGLTFEIDFETTDVQNDDAVIMNFSDSASANGSFIKINATSAQLNTNANANIKTNFRDGTRNKIAFTFNPIMPIAEAKNASGNPNLVFIYVNGVLDRAARWGNGNSVDSDSVLWTGNTVKSIVIGNPNGEATTKIYSIRIYKVALLPEQAFMNYLVDSGSRLKSIYDKNNVLDTEGNISLDKVKEFIPVLIVSADTDAISGANRDKKKNVSFVGQYFDCTDPSLNFFVRNGWLSCQGTSSMNYPVKNLRPYFNKASDSKSTLASIQTISGSTEPASNYGINTQEFRYETEFWPVSEYKGHEDDVMSYVDEQGILPYACNSKVDKKGYHEIAQGCTLEYKKSLATKYAEKEEIFSNTKGSILCTPDTENKASLISGVYDANSDAKLYISAYRPLRRTDMSDDEYKKFIMELRYSGVKLYKKSEEFDDAGNLTAIIFEELKKKKSIYKIDKETNLETDKVPEYYGLGGYWRQYNEAGHISGWTDRWTLKADYAESSMCHNSGVARLWGNALKNVAKDGVFLCRTNAQTAAAALTGGGIDIRTSCDGKPIVTFFKKPIGYNKTTGYMEYGAAEYAGLYNIMTDKSSTKLFGFEDIYDEHGNRVFQAYNGDDDVKYAADPHNVQCWEFLQNGSLIAQGLSLAMDVEGEANISENGVDSKYGDGRTIFNDFEGRWPETGQERHEYIDETEEEALETANGLYWPDDVYGVDTSQFESFWNWLNFTKPAVNYTVDGFDGYDYSDYVAFDNFLNGVVPYKIAHPDEKLYIMRVESGNDKYYAEGEEWIAETIDNPDGTITYEMDSFTIFDSNGTPIDRGVTYYRKKSSVNRENVGKSINTKKIGEIIGQDVYIGRAPSFDAIYRCYDLEGNIDDTLAARCLVDVYLTRSGNSWLYTNNYGKQVQYGVSSIPGVAGLFEQVDPEDFEKNANGQSWRNSTFMQYFSATKYDHLDVNKVAAYYVYLMRFGAVDQAIKNSMMTTEDGKHWYYINYDNDTTLGVRNDAILKYNWDFDRDTWDESIESYAYAGARSILWNNLSMDDDFMALVKQIDNVMYSLGLLSEETVLDYLNNKQMNTWCERLYNHQEEIKYLSTFKKDFNTQKFLDFLQGTRVSHRNWWVHKRWELYDAKWNTGSYSQKRIEFYDLTSAASPNNPLELVRVTASSKYYFTMLTNGRQPFTDWFVEADPGDTFNFSTTMPFGIGDPLAIVGPAKIKVLNFRPSGTTLSGVILLNPSYDIFKDGGYVTTSWVEEAGTTMTKLLIGEPTKLCTVAGIDGINSITSLEEVDITNCIGLESSPTLTDLKNLHIYRASNSTAGEFNPANGCTLYEVSLPSADVEGSREVVVRQRNGDGVLTDDTVTLIIDRPTTLKTLILNDVTFMENPNEYVQYQPGLYGDYLPEYGEDAHKYCTDKTANYVFDCKPTAKLNRVEFNNVTGLDTKSFVMDWKNAIITSGQSLANYTLSLTGIDWSDITVDELIEFRFGRKSDDSRTGAFNFSAFTGKISVKSNNPANRSIDYDEYLRLIKYFNTDGVDVFNPKSALVIDAPANIFFKPIKDDEFVPVTNDGSAINTTNTDKIYEIPRGTRFEVSATIFPIKEDEQYVYVLERYLNTSTSARIQNVTGTIGVDYTFNDTTRTTTAVSLANTNKNTAIFFASDELNPDFTDNAAYKISVWSVVDGELVKDMTRESQSYIYIKVINNVVPAYGDIAININDGETTTNVSGSIVPVINKLGQHKISFSYPDTFNATVNTVTVGIEAVDNNILNIDRDSLRIDGHNIEFTFNPVYPEASKNINVLFTIKFNTQQEGKDTVLINKTFNVQTIYPTAIKLFDTELNEITTEMYINNLVRNDYIIKVLPENYNVPITKIEMETVDILDPVTNTGNPDLITITDIENNRFSVTANDNNYQSFLVRFNKEIKYSHGYDNEAHPVSSVKFNLKATMVYPTNIMITEQDYNNNSASNYVHSGLTPNQSNIYLTDNQGTVGSNLLITGQNDYIEFRVSPQPFAADENNVVDITENFTAAIEEINIPAEYQDVVSVFDGHVKYDESDTQRTGDMGFRLKIQPESGKSDTIVVTGKYSLTYDHDRDVETEARKIDFNFTVNIHRSVAAAITYERLQVGKVYLVDAESRYYTVDFENEASLDPTDLALKNGISMNNTTIAQALSDNNFPGFIGVGSIAISGSRILPRFITFDTYYNDGTDVSQMFYTNSVPFIKILPGTADSKKYADNNDSSYVEYPFAGSINTDFIYSKYNTAEYSTVVGGWKSVLNKFNDNPNISAFVPLNRELQFLFNTQTNMYKKYDRMINLLIAILRGANLTDQLEHITLLEDCKITIQSKDYFMYYTSSLHNNTEWGVMVYGSCQIDSNKNIVIPQSSEEAMLTASPISSISPNSNDKAYVRPFLKVK